ncbi:MAG: hypothetical protein JRN46_01375 [Nitrososphaerota archaeon]|nr:hypothetical protein [Nitrososphaerota archaeon]
MKPAGTGSGTKRWWRRAALVAALVVVVAAVGALEAFPSRTYAFQVPSAVGFSVSANSTAVAPGQTIRLTMKDVNYLPFPNEPKSYFVFPNGLNMSAGVCGLLAPFGVAAYEGHDTLGNISSATQVAVFDDFGFYSCLASLNPFALGPFQSAARAAYLDGYWTAGETQAPGGGYTQGVLHPFAPGEYTVAVGDGWGHTSLVYFQVDAGA